MVWKGKVLSILMVEALKINTIWNTKALKSLLNHFPLDKSASVKNARDNNTADNKTYVAW